MVHGLLDLGQLVAGHQHGAPGRGERAQKGAQPGQPFRVQTGAGLIEHQHPRIPEQRGGQREPLAHAQREAADVPVRRLGQPDQCEYLVGPLVRHPDRGSVHPQVGPPGAGPVETLGVEHGTDHGGRGDQLVVADPVDGGLALGRRDQTERDAQRGGLAGAVRTEEAGHLARLDGEAQVPHRLDGAEALAQVAHHDAAGTLAGVAGSAADVHRSQSLPGRSAQCGAAVAVANTSRAKSPSSVSASSARSTVPVSQQKPCTIVSSCRSRTCTPACASARA